MQFLTSNQGVQHLLQSYPRPNGNSDGETETNPRTLKNLRTTPKVLSNINKQEISLNKVNLNLTISPLAIQCQTLIMVLKLYKIQNQLNRKNTWILHIG